MSPLPGSMKKTEIRTPTWPERPLLVPAAVSARERLRPCLPPPLAQTLLVHTTPGTPDTPLAREQGPSEAPNPISDLRRYFSLLCHRGHLAHV